MDPEREIPPDNESVARMWRICLTEKRIFRAFIIEYFNLPRDATNEQINVLMEQEIIRIRARR